MGTWGIGSFENDTASDWLFDFAENDFRLIDRTLAAIASQQEGEPIDADEACEVLAAAECVAAAAGYPIENLPDEVTQWLADHQPIQVRQAYVRMARTAVAHVRAHSELKELWQETDEYNAWDSAVANLQTRLEQIEE